MLAGDFKKFGRVWWILILVVITVPRKACIKNKSLVSFFFHFQGRSVQHSCDHLQYTSSTRLILSQFWSFSIRRTMFMKYIKFVDLLIVKGSVGYLPIHFSFWRDWFASATTYWRLSLSDEKAVLQSRSRSGPVNSRRGWDSRKIDLKIWGERERGKKWRRKTMWQDQTGIYFWKWCMR